MLFCLIPASPLLLQACYKLCIRRAKRRYVPILISTLCSCTELEGRLARKKIEIEIPGNPCGMLVMQGY